MEDEKAEADKASGGEDDAADGSPFPNEQGEQDGIDDNSDNGDEDDQDEDGDNEDRSDENEDNDDDVSNEEEEDGNDDMNDSDSSSDDSSNSDDDDEEGGESQPSVIIKDGRELSEYEIKRLERIRKNKEYLKQLGLEGDNGVLGSRPTTKKKKKPASSAPVPVKKRSSRRAARKKVDYSEPSATIASLLRAEEPKKKDDDKGPRKSRDKANRLERFIYDEFKSIASRKKNLVREAERYVRAAEKEVKFWTRMVEKEERRERRKQEGGSLYTKKDEEIELIGCTLRELLQEVDSRMPELIEAAEKYDDEFQVREVVQQR